MNKNKPSLSIILDNMLGYISSGNVGFNVVVTFDVFARGAVDHVSTDANWFFIAALLTCMFKNNYRYLFAKMFQKLLQNVQRDVEYYSALEVDIIMLPYCISVTYQ